jgi:hypothetical protein
MTARLVLILIGMARRLLFDVHHIQLAFPAVLTFRIRDVQSYNGVVVNKECRLTCALK